jgi:hypothetical protein
MNICLYNVKKGVLFAEVTIISSGGLECFGPATTSFLLFGHRIDSSF